jgi:hypothetical protein
VDVHIVEVGGHVSGQPMAPDAMLGEQANTSGNGWIGVVEWVEDVNERGPIRRLTLTAAATNTLISCWIGYRDPADATWADAVVKSLRQDPIS